MQCLACLQPWCAGLAAQPALHSAVGVGQCGLACRGTPRAARLQVVQAFVRQAMGYLDQAPDKDTRVELIKTLQTVTEGKVGPDYCHRTMCCQGSGFARRGACDQAAMQWSVGLACLFACLLQGYRCTTLCQVMSF